MSYAVETKKRKFHRVLESLTKPSSTDSAPKLSTADVSLKKPRLGNRNDGSELAAARRAILKVARPSSGGSTTSTASRPSFVPWDRERFLERLETFRRVDWWSPKPSAINEVEWAKRGWICTGASRVTCVGGCGGSVVVKLPDELDELDGYDREKIQERKEVRKLGLILSFLGVTYINEGVGSKLVEEYAGRLVQGHGENCPWKNKGCDGLFARFQINEARSLTRASDTIHRLPLTNPDVAIANLHTRYTHVNTLADQLPAQDILQTPASFDPDDIITFLPTKTFQSSEASAPSGESQTVHATTETQDTLPQSPPPAELSINKTALVFAFFGWDTVSDGKDGLLGCTACFRRLGLWMYRPKENGGAPLYDSLDLVQEHMEYCPWVNGKAQSGTGRASEKEDNLQSGWQLLAHGLKVKHRRHIRSTTSTHSRAASEAPSSDGFSVDEKQSSDREWWAKIRRMRQVLNVKSPKKPPPRSQ